MMQITNEVLHERLDNLAKTNTAEHDTICDKQNKTNGRLSSLEKYKYKAVGAILMLNVLAIPLIIWWITEKVVR